MTRLLNTPIIGRNAAPVASSCNDMLAGLSKNEILSTPPDFWADAGCIASRPISIDTAAAKNPGRPFITFTSLFICRYDPRA